MVELPKQRALGVKVPFSFFLANDNEDLDGLFDLICEKLLDGKYDYQYWEGRGEHYGAYTDVWLDMFFMEEHGELSVSYISSDMVWILDFTIFAKLKE